jgi:hypothetical protein
MTPPYPGTPQGNLLTAFFDELERAGLAYVVLRNWETLPDRPVGDVDIVTHDVAKAGQVLYGVSGAHEFVPIRVARHTWHRIHGLAPRAALSDAQPVVVDIQPGVTHRRGISIAADRVLDGRVRSGPFWRPAPGVEAAAIMLHCAIDRRAMPDRYQRRMQELARTDPQRFVSELGVVAGERAARNALEEPAGQLAAVSQSFRGQPGRAQLVRTGALLRYLRGPGPVVHVAPGVELELRLRGVRIAASRIEARRRLGVVVREDGDAGVDAVLELCRREYT